MTTARPAPGRGGKRLDRALLDLGLAPSRRIARELIAGGHVRVNGRILAKGDFVGPSDQLEVALAARPTRLVANPALAPAVPYEDAAVLVVAKPGLVPCLPLRLSETDTLMNGVVALFPETAAAGANPLEGGLVHRLDNGASGAVMVARSASALILLREALRDNRITREYDALALGELIRPLEIDTPIGHRAGTSKRMVLAPVGEKRSVRGHARPALTRVEPVRVLGAATLLRVIPITGVRHQIRVHLASVELPLVGDELYGGARDPRLAPGRFFLHLRRLRFESPTGASVDVEAPISAELAAVLGALETPSPEGQLS